MEAARKISTVRLTKKCEVVRRLPFAYSDSENAYGLKVIVVPQEAG